MKTSTKWSYFLRSCVMLLAIASQFAVEIASQTDVNASSYGEQSKMILLK